MFLYCEDTDICWRLRLAGLRIAVCPDVARAARVRVQPQPAKMFHLERNRLLMLGGQLRGSRRSRASRPRCSAPSSRCCVVAARGGWLPQKLQAIASAARALPAVRAQRRAVSLLRRIPDSGLSRRLERRLGPEFGEGVARATAPLLEAYARLARLR